MNGESNQEGHASRFEGLSRIFETQERTRLCTCGRPQDECSDQVTLGYPITMPVTGVPMQNLNQPPRATLFGSLCYDTAHSAPVSH